MLIMLHDGYSRSEIEKPTLWWIEHVQLEENKHEQTHTFPLQRASMDAAWVNLPRAAKDTALHRSFSKQDEVWCGFVARTSWSAPKLWRRAVEARPSSGAAAIHWGHL